MGRLHSVHDSENPIFFLSFYPSFTVRFACQLSEKNEKQTELSGRITAQNSILFLNLVPALPNNSRDCALPTAAKTITLCFSNVEV